MKLFRSLFFLLPLSIAGASVAEISVDEAMARLKEKQHASTATQPATRPDATHAAVTPPPKAGAQAGTEEEHYDNGQLKSRFTLNPAGLRWGPYTLFSEDGKRTERGSYKNAELDGTRQTFYPNTHVKLQENYKKGVLDGPVLENDEKGTAVRTAEFKGGVPVSDRTLVEGLVVYPRSIAMIQLELARIKKMKVDTIPASTAIPPHAGGNDSQEDREEAVRRLMEYRYLSYVPHEGMLLDALFCAHDEAASAILAEIGTLNHKPDNPGWPVDRYKFAYEGTSHSNIYMRSPASSPECVRSVDGYMNDSDAHNIAVVGHRRWCLNPAMGKTGFASFKGFSAMWSFDMSRKQIPDYDFVAFPGPGFYPSSHFHDDYAWSISLNTSKYLAPRESSVKVAVTPVQIQLSQNKITPSAKPLELEHFNVNNEFVGIPNSIIFRPTGITTEPGSAYLVEVTGLQSKDAKPATLRYTVEFFAPAQPDVLKK